LWREPLGPRREDRDLGRRLRPLIGALMLTAPGRRALLRGAVARPELVPAVDARRLVSDYLGSSGYSDANREMRAGVFEHDGRVAVPVTLAWGELDRVVGRPSRTRRPPGARYVEMPGWGHIPTWDDPEGVARLLLDGSRG
jgi:pimeloyl-ACP methyl ester carboxylesterase